MQSDRGHELLLSPEQHIATGTCTLAAHIYIVSVLGFASSRIPPGRQNLLAQL